MPEVGDHWRRAARPRVAWTAASFRLPFCQPVVWGGFFGDLGTRGQRSVTDTESHRDSPTQVSPEIAELFADFTNPGGRSNTKMSDLFSEEFLNLDPASCSVVQRGQLIAALPARSQLFSSIGAEGTTLVELEEHRIDEAHRLVHTAWKVRFTDPDAKPLTLRSTYLLRREDDSWRAVVYLNHLDLKDEIGARLRSLPDSTAVPPA
jgi:hypothetical protein